MTDYLRQLLADELNDIGQSIERYEKAIDKLENQLRTKRLNLAKLRDKEKQLQKGVDW